MNEENAFAPPTTDIRENPDIDGGSKLDAMSFSAVKKLYNHSRSLIGLVFLWCIGLIVLALAMIGLGTINQDRVNNKVIADTATLAIVLGVMCALLLAGIIGCWTRQSWGRTVGIILCILMLLTIFNYAVLIALIGLFGLIALGGGGRLFGPDRITHTQLKAEVARRKLLRA